MLRVGLHILCLVASALAATSRDSNTFLDNVLKEKIPSIVRSSPVLFPKVNIDEFKFKVDRTAITNRDLKVKMKEGSIKGFDTGVHRVGDCKPPVWRGDNSSIVCTLDFSGIEVTFNSKVEGDSLTGGDKRVPITVNIVSTTALFEATALPGRPGSVRTFYIENINLRTTHGNSLTLNDTRMRKFIEEIEKKVHPLLFKYLYGDYLILLNRAVEASTFPRP